MKKTTLLLVLFVAGFMNAQIVNIPDANFKDRLITIGVDTNTDGEIQVSEAAAVTGMLNVASQNIADLQGIEAFTNITGLNCFENLLTSLDLSSNTLLTTLNCVSNQITSLNVTSNTFLESLEIGDNFITTLDVSNNINLEILRINSNPLAAIDLSNNIALTDFSLFASSVTTLDFSANTNLIGLSFINNQALETVFIKNGSDESANIDSGSWLENWLLGNNPSLTYVCADADQVSEIQSFAGGGYVVNSYCNFQPGGDFNTIQGVAQFDLDNDGCDSGDPVIPYLNFNVGLDPDPADSSVYSDAIGIYNLYVGETGTYSILANFEDASYFTVDPSPASVTIPVVDNSTTIQDFCVTANGIRPDAEVVIAPIFRSRPGFDATYQLVYKNKGNQTLSGSVDFTYDDAVLDFVSSTTTPDAQSTGLLSFNFTNLQPFESRFVDIVLNVNDPTETPPVNIDDVLTFTSNIAIDQTEETPDDNSFEYNEVVVGSFDPNDITCLQGDVAPSSLIGDFLHYVINFENTGNAPAQNVVVTTEIDPVDFDINSLQILNASDAMSLSITENLVTFVFENINLSSGGHGNILLKVRTNSDLVVSDFVAADAAIYFDFNFPITTNTANTTFETLSVDEFLVNQVIAVYPNPSDKVVTIEATSAIQIITMYDMQGRAVLSNEENTASIAIDISQFANGMYFLVIKTDSGEVTKRVIKK
ncbi:T9SS type A sorting domain-containing protein [Dokdonia ponticola]|uniref:T9SS type A sorting domain-containing protein n=1 Tax=Dokdonia ponticola TaxID=2041041 RepID=A0ABV9HWP4_9FLAO